MTTTLSPQSADPVLIDSIRSNRQATWQEAFDLAKRADEEHRSFTANEQRDYDQAVNMLDAYDRRLVQVQEETRRYETTAGALRNLGARDTGPIQRGGDELRSFLRGGPGSPRVFDVQPSGNEFRTLSKLTAAAGSNVVPTSFYGQLVQHMVETSPILDYATVLQTSGGENLQVPKTTAHSAAAIVSEGAAIAASDPAFGQVTLGAYKYGLLIQVSRELVDDQSVDLESYLADQAGTALGRAFGSHAATGTGTGQPRGFSVDATVGATSPTGTVGAPSYDTLVDLQMSVLPAYRSRAVWIMRDSTIGAVRKLKDTTGQPIWTDSMAAGQPPLLLGSPVISDPFLAATGLNARSVFYGDLSKYFVRIAGGVRFERSDEFSFGNDLVTYRALLRADGVLVDTSGAVKVAVGAAT